MRSAWLAPALASFALGLLGSAFGGSVLVLPTLAGVEAKLDNQEKDVVELRTWIATTNGRIDALLDRLARERRNGGDSRATVPPGTVKNGG